MYNELQLSISVGGNCNTVLVANIYGEAAHMEDTVSGRYVHQSESRLFLSALGDNQYSLQLSTLRFASRMKCVQTHAAVNEHNGTAVSSHTPHTTTLLGGHNRVKKCLTFVYRLHCILFSE